MNQYYLPQLRHGKKVVLLFLKCQEHGLSAVTRVDPCLCCSISCCVKCMQDDLRLCFFLVTLQIRHISLGLLGVAAIGHYSSGSISFCILDGLFCEVLYQLILCIYKCKLSGVNSSLQVFKVKTKVVHQIERKIAAKRDKLKNTIKSR